MEKPELVGKFLVDYISLYLTNHTLGEYIEQEIKALQTSSKL
jgi:hypothetical protein